jgi:hypothetical protein
MRTLLPLFALLIACPQPITIESDGDEFEGDTPGECSDGADNDRDGYYDCDDQECWAAPDCSGDDDDTANDDDAADDDDAVDDDDTADDDDAVDDDDSTPIDGSEHAIYANTSSALYSIDPDPPYTATLIGNFSGQIALSQGITDIAISLDGTMYAVGFWEVYRVDPNTAALTLLAADTLPGEVFNSLTVRSDGVLIGGAGSTLYEIDPNSGARSQVGDTGSWILAGDVVGLPDGLLYCLMSSTGIESDPTSLVTINLDPANLTEVGATGQGAMFGVAYDVPNDLIYGFDQGGQIVTIDPSTGAGTVVSNSGIPFWGATTNPARWSGR